MSPDALFEHFQALAAELGVVTVYNAETFKDELEYEGEALGAYSLGWPFDDLDLIVVVVAMNREPRDREALLVALHELGHVAVRHVDRKGRLKVGRRKASLLGQEALAWLWALEHLPWDPKPDDWHQIAWRLRTYWDAHRSRRKPRIFIDLLARAEEGAAA
ncbi:MAG TPA: hypothetical protein VIV12_25810 [Streptosporangiaceae bacterium]